MKQLMDFGFFFKKKKKIKNKLNVNRKMQVDGFFIGKKSTRLKLFIYGANGGLSSIK